MKRGARCRCGDIVMQILGSPRWVANCHCGECRKATGSAFATYASFSDDAVQITQGEPARFGSSSGVERVFCAACGTPVAYRGDRWPGEWHLFIGFLDDSADLAPKVNVYLRDKLPWTHLDPALGAFETVA